MGMRDSTINISDFFMASPRESVNKSAASAASLDYVKNQAVIKSAAGAASLHEGRPSGRLAHGVFVGISSAAKK